MPPANFHGVEAEIFIMFHTLVIGVKLFKKLNDKVKSGKSSCLDNWTIATTPMSGRTHTSPCDSG
jgi:hypothetical protein